MLDEIRVIDQRLIIEENGMMMGLRGREEGKKKCETCTGQTDDSGIRQMACLPSVGV